MAELKVEVSEELIKYCEQKGIKPERLVEVALEKYLFHLVYQEITA